MIYLENNKKNPDEDKHCKIGCFTQYLVLVVLKKQISFLYQNLFQFNKTFQSSEKKPGVIEDRSASV